MKMRKIVVNFIELTTVLILCFCFSSPLPAQSLATPDNGKPDFTRRAGGGYEYLMLAQPDTGRGTFRGLNLHQDFAVAKKIWLGTGIAIGRTDLSEFTRVRIIDRSIVDSLGFFLARDSIVSEHRWQNHLAVPFRATLDLAGGTYSSIQLSLGTTLGIVYNKGSINQYDQVTRISKHSSPHGFTGFITADLGLGYQVFQLERLSVMLSAEGRYVVAGHKSYGFGNAFVGGKALVNFYW
jgi:hypothetical protein